MYTKPRETTSGPDTSSPVVRSTLTTTIRMPSRASMAERARPVKPMPVSARNVRRLYNFAGQPWKTQARVRQIMDTFYAARPDGLIGNEDCGQMSAWYVLSASGFYPVLPGDQRYDIGTPLEVQVERDRMLDAAERFSIPAVSTWSSVTGRFWSAFSRPVRSLSRSNSCRLPSRFTTTRRAPSGRS